MTVQRQDYDALQRRRPRKAGIIRMTRRRRKVGAAGALSRSSWRFWRRALIRRRPAATTERVVADRHTGLAIGGFDPVAYFTDSARSRAWANSRRLPPAWSGASATRVTAPPSSRIRRSTCRSSAATIRSIVTRRDDRGQSAVLVVVTGARLYLFYREDNRDAFTAEPGRFMQATPRRAGRSVRDNLAQ